MTLTPKRSIITSNDEKKMIQYMFFYSKILIFCENLSFWMKNAVFFTSENQIRKKSKLY